MFLTPASRWLRRYCIVPTSDRRTANTAGDRKAARAARRRVGILGSTQEGRGASRPDKWPPRQRKTPPCVDCVERRGLLAAGYLLNTHVADFTVTCCQLALQPPQRAFDILQQVFWLFEPY